MGVGDCRKKLGTERVLIDAFLGDFIHGYISCTKKGCGRRNLACGISSSHSENPCLNEFGILQMLTMSEI